MQIHKPVSDCMRKIKTDRQTGLLLTTKSAVNVMIWLKEAGRATNIHEVSKSVRETVIKIDRQADVSPVRGMDIPSDESLFNIRQ